ncbi:MAG: phage tail tape measure protein [Solirubrobacteraceae bacterium]|nr:phage tail tape measure protein [Solirubrobacteraceae bacterium]
MAAEDLSIRIRAIGSDQAAAAVRDVRGEVDGLGDGTEEATGRMDRALGRAKRAVAALGVAIGGLAVKGIVDALDMQEGHAKMAAQLGMTADQAERIGKVAGGLYSDAYGEGLADVNDAIVQIGQNMTDLGDVSDAELRKASASVLNLQSTFDASGQEITRTVSALMANGMAGSFDEAFDVITSGFTRGADKGGEFLDTLNEYAEPMKSLGFDAKTFTGLLVQGAEQGVYSVDKIGDAFKEFSIRAIDGSTATVDAYKSLGLSADDYAQRLAKGGPSAQKATGEILAALRKMRDPVTREAAGVALFGSMWEDIGGQAILGLDPATAAMERTAGAADKLDDTLLGTGKATLRSFSRQLQMGIANVAESYVLPALQDLGNVVRDLGGPLKAIVAPFRALGVDGKAVAAVLAVLAGGLATYKVATTAAAFATGALNTVMSMNPLARVVIVLAAVAAGLVMLYRRSESFRNVVNALWSGVKAAFAGIRTIVTSVVSAVVGAITRTIGIIRTLVSAARSAGSAVGSAFRAIGSAASSAYSTVRRYLGNVVSFLTGLPGKVVEAAKSIGKAIVDGIVAGIKAAPNAVIDAVGSIVPGPIKGIMKKAGGALGALGGVLGLADGGTVTTGGLTWVGERGPELLHLPPGARVWDHRTSMRASRTAPLSTGERGALSPTAVPVPTGGSAAPVVEVAVYVDGDQVAARIDRRVKRSRAITGRTAIA